MDWMRIALRFSGDLVCLIVGVVALWQLLEWRTARRVRALVELNDRLQDSEARRARRTVYNLPSNATPEDAAHWSDESKWDIELVCANFEMAGLLAAEGVVSYDWLARNWRFALVHSWERALPLVNYYRQTRARDYWHYFETLVRRAQATPGA